VSGGRFGDHRPSASAAAAALARARAAGPCPSTPSRCAETPTQAKPARGRLRWTVSHSAATSAPDDTFSHSTTTVPVNAAGSAGR
jgi:hypothetical protein